MADLQGICHGHNVDVVALLAHGLNVPPAELLHSHRIIHHPLWQSKQQLLSTLLPL